MAKTKAEKEALKKAKAAHKASEALRLTSEKEAKKLAKLASKGSKDSHTELNKELSHKDFPLFLKKNFEEAGEKINQ
jgi:hypothetical protein